MQIIKTLWQCALPVLALMAVLAWPQPARAQCQYPFCEGMYAAIDSAIFPLYTAAAESEMTADFQVEEQTMTADFFDLDLKAGMAQMAAQLTAAGMLQMAAIGSFIDAKQQLETQRLFQEKAALAHKNYQPSTEMCMIGTVANGLGAAYHNGETTALLLSQHARAREMLSQATASAPGGHDDVTARLAQFQKRYCDPNDDNLSQVCANSAPGTSVNKDIDFMRTVYEPLTINADFTDGNLSGDEQDVLALGENLYAHHLFPKISPETLNQPGNQGYLLDWRAIVAKHSVAENSFNALVGMKAADNAANAAKNAKYLAVVLQQLGASSTDAQTLIGSNPSYYARMELLTKKIYEEPEFYTALYDTPANVARKGAALRAIDLMQQMDSFNSQLRNEAMLAELVELDVIKEQSRVQDTLPLVTNAGQ